MHRNIFLVTLIPLACIVANFFALNETYAQLQDQSGGIGVPDVWACGMNDPHPNCSGDINRFNNVPGAWHFVTSSPSPTSYSNKTSFTPSIDWVDSVTSNFQGTNFDQWTFTQINNINCQFPLSANLSGSFSDPTILPVIQVSPNQADSITYCYAYGVWIPGSSYTTRLKSFANTYTYDSVAPSIPSNLTGTFSGNQIQLTWQASTDATSGLYSYDIQKSLDGGQTYTPLNYIYTGATTYQHFSVSLNTSYMYRIRATDKANNSSGWSNAITVVTDATPPNSVIDLMIVKRGTLGTSHQVDIQWTPISDAHDYDIYTCSYANNTDCVTSTVYSGKNLQSPWSIVKNFTATDPSIRVGTYNNKTYSVYTLTSSQPVASYDTHAIKLLPKDQYGNIAVNSSLAILGDGNSDHAIDITDVINTIPNIHAQTYDLLKDVNRDGVVDITDIVQILGCIHHTQCYLDY